MKISEISGEKFNELAFAEPNTSIYQSTYFANYMAKQDYRSIFVQASNDSDICTSLAMILLKKKSLLSRKTNAYCPYGFLTNYYDSEDFLEFHKDLLKYLKKHHRVSTLTIEPFIEIHGDEKDNHLRYFIENVGYNKTNDLSLFKIDINQYKKLEINKNLFFKFSRSDSKDFIETFISDDKQDYLDKYHAFEKYGRIYQLALDSFRTKTSIKNNIEENTSFINQHKEDYKYQKTIENKNQENNYLNAMLAMINKYENLYGVNPVLGISFIVNYADNYEQIFTINKDDNNLFHIDEALLNNIISDLKKEKVNTLFSFEEMKNSEKMNLLGQFSIDV